MRFAQFFSALSLLAVSIAVLAESRSEERRIVELESEWSDMFGDQNLDGITALMAEKSVLIMPGVEPVVGIEGIRQATQAMFDSDDEVSWQSDFAYVSASGDMAYDYGTATTRLSDGTSVQGNYLVVWIKEDGEWRVAADMFN